MLRLLNNSCLWLMLLAMSLGGSLAMAAESAQDLMDKAHEGRAVWKDFPGFTAEVTATRNGQATTGKLSVDADGNLTLELAEPADMDWVERSLRSVVNHRLSSDAGVTDVVFADEDTQHPFGRLIKSTKDVEKSQWRVKGDVMTEVHRFHDKSHMVISVVEVSRTQEGTHLPHSFNVTSWNIDTKAIESNRQVYNEWRRVARFDLPARLLAAVSKPDGTRSVEEIKLSKHALLPSKANSNLSISELPPLKSPVTSFGAGIADGYLYVYGGHLGQGHKYSADQQAKQLLRLNLADPQAWEEVATGPGRTGLAMVAYKNAVYRIGGWEAKNDAGEEWNLYSSRDFAKYDVKSGKWTDLAPLPQGRSSHDSALIGSKLYVVGGWELGGKGDGDWHNTALVCDLNDSSPTWQEIAKLPFYRRALAVAGYQGKLYVIGGMDDSNDTTTAMHVYDPQSNTWEAGTAIPGKPMDGFGASAFGSAKGLFVSTIAGKLYRLDDNGEKWTEVGELNHPRYFHRLVASDDGQLLIVGGTSKGGKVAEVEAVKLP